MTITELNRDINRLLKLVIKNKSDDLDLITKEFKRLYYASSDLSDISKKSVLILLRINLMYRFIPLHTFGLKIELEKL